eukprot:scaffold63952_cov29-Prasinocladus_malaysianus.AAC.1
MKTQGRLGRCAVQQRASGPNLTLVRAFIASYAADRSMRFSAATIGRSPVLRWATDTGWLAE